MEFPGGGGSTARPSGTENPGGWGGQTGKTLHGGGMDIFWNHTMYTCNICSPCGETTRLNCLTNQKTILQFQEKYLECYFHNTGLS